jgi:hypothetical protein
MVWRVPKSRSWFLARLPEQEAQVRRTQTYTASYLLSVGKKFVVGVRGFVCSPSDGVLYVPYVPYTVRGSREPLPGAGTSNKCAHTFGFSRTIGGQRDEQWLTGLGKPGFLVFLVRRRCGHMRLYKTCLLWGFRSFVHLPTTNEEYANTGVQVTEPQIMTSLLSHVHD